MDAPPVQYVTTSDGYNVAYSVSGQGTPLVLVPFHLSHVELDWHPDAPTEPWMKGLSQRFRFVHYDPRGQGLSTRDLPQNLAREDWLRDLDAVVDRLRLDRFVLLGVNILGHIAVQYAAKNPERLQALILMNFRSSVAGWMTPLAEQSWDLYLHTQISADTSVALRDNELARLRLAAKQTDFLTYMRAFSLSSIAEDLPRLRMPTLILHGRDLPWFGPEHATTLAALIPNSRLVLLDGAVMPNAAQGLAAIDRFLSDLNGPSGALVEESVPSGLSPREIEVLRLLAAGKSNPEIAKELFITRNTVQNHVSSILTKTNLTNRAQAAVYANDHGIV